MFSLSWYMRGFDPNSVMLPSISFACESVMLRDPKAPDIALGRPSAACIWPESPLAASPGEKLNWRPSTYNSAGGFP